MGILLESFFLFNENASQFDLKNLNLNHLTSISFLFFSYFRSLNMVEIQSVNISRIYCSLEAHALGAQAGMKPGG